MRQRGENLRSTNSLKNNNRKRDQKIIHLTDLLSRYGNMLGLPHSKALGGGLYELRIRGKEEIRIFYCFTHGRTIYLLHVFKKQTQETPAKELNLAVQRREELKNV